MPVFIMDGESHRVPFIPFFRAYRSTHNAKIVRTSPKASTLNAMWSAQDDRILWNLRTCNVPWKYISAAMNNRPVDDLKKRWVNHLHEGRSTKTAIKKSTTNVKHVFYTDENFDLEDVLLLHTIAAKWEKDKWLTVSARFNARTGRNITSEEAKSMIDL
ncbi:hypothetical protein BDV28DRAFT_160778 [Aspergillus coremiiformis]|uniref:Myb-like domain-containing protein n=1 Tax=Aspergillus coremiiformis TaxID=138285 RepID=A0A5N6YXF9_9EURO|nr:hypothetical protein BDV28DRAFT_160778 [Aspergillus coremiiformis]